MKVKFIFVFVIMIQTGIAQVGIGTTMPEQELHISGFDSTIRIESLNETNSILNDGVRLAPAFVNGNGDITLYGNGNSGIDPLNFLIDVPNFLADNPYGHTPPYDLTGTVINSSELISENSDVIGTVLLSVPKNALIEFKYGVTTYIRGSDMKLIGPWIEPVQEETVRIGIFFCVDINNNGLDATELSKIYGIKSLSYESNFGGIPGHPYVNGQGYVEIPGGNHMIYFYGVVKDNTPNFTSVGFGGAEDFLKIRVFE